MQSTGQTERKSTKVTMLWSIGLLSALLILVLAGCAYEAAIGSDYDNTPDDYSYLAQYGTWTDVAPYGSVWVPSVAPGWEPFTYGHWDWTDQGWAWVSYEPYGWLVYHYGNWDYKTDVGWFWIEGDTWSPAQAQWVDYDDYVGWAPIPPAGEEWPDPWNETSFHPWVMVTLNHFDAENVEHHRLNRAPEPKDPDRQDVFHGPADIGRIESYKGEELPPMKVERRDLPVYMHPDQFGQHRDDRDRFEANHRGEGSNHEIRNRDRNEGRRVQLNRMALPQDERARVEQHRKDFEHRMLVNRDNGHDHDRGRDHDSHSDRD
jgi:hypothetical protein